MNYFWIAVFYAAYFGFVGLYSPFLGPYLKTLGHSLDVIAVCLGLMQVMRIVGPFLWAWLADRSGKTVKWIRLGSTAGLFISMLAFAKADSAVWIIVGIVFLNFAISGLVPLSDSYCMDIAEGNTGTYGKVRLFGSLGFIFSVIGFGWWAEVLGFSEYVIWVWLSLALCAFAAWQFTPLKSIHVDYQTQQSQKAETGSFSFGKTLSRAMPSHWMQTGSFQALFHTQGIRLFWLASFFMIFAHGIFYAYFSLFMQEVGYGEGVIGVFWGIGVALEVLFFAVQGWLMPKLRLVSWLQLTFFACFVRFGLIALSPDIFWVVMFAQAGHSLTFAAHHTATVSWLRENLPKSVLVRGQATYATIAYGLGGTTGTIVGRYLWEWVSPNAAFACAALAGLLALWFGSQMGKLSST